MSMVDRRIRNHSLEPTRRRTLQGYRLRPRGAVVLSMSMAMACRLQHYGTHTSAQCSICAPRRSTYAPLRAPRRGREGAVRKCGDVLLSLCWRLRRRQVRDEPLAETPHPVPARHSPGTLALSSCPPRGTAGRQAHRTCGCCCSHASHAAHRHAEPRPQFILR